MGMFVFLYLLKGGRVYLLNMAPRSLLMALMVVATATGAIAAKEENELDYGYWNYREGGINHKPVFDLSCSEIRSS